MKHAVVRSFILCSIPALVFGEGASLAQMAATAPAHHPASQPKPPTRKGTIKSFDAATGRITLNWKHSRQPEPMEFLAKLTPNAQVTIDGKPAAVADIRTGDRVELFGKGETVAGENSFFVTRIAINRQPTSAPATANSQVDQILDRLEKKGDQVHDIQTRITFTKIDPVLEDKQVFQGILRFKEDKPNPRFFIRFDKFTQEGVTRESKEWHVFDGQWYTEAREKTKTIVRRQVVRPGEEVNVFRLGQGPFPLPFGQKKSDIEKHFVVKLSPSQPADPPNSVHLECTPKPGSDMEKKYGKIDFYVDKDMNLPTRVRTTEKTENVQVVADFPAPSTELNKGLAASELNLPELKEYQVDSVPLPAPGKP